MSSTAYRTVEPLYIIILRNNPKAESLLRAWIRDNRVDHAIVAGNKMMLHDHGGFEQFRITWRHEWDCLTIWDNWQKRHIYLD